MAFQVRYGQRLADLALPDITHDTSAVALRMQVEKQNRQPREARSVVHGRCAGRRRVNVNERGDDAPAFR
jgi:hypothetical protein